MRLRYQFEAVQSIRDFFREQGFLETLTPPMVENPGMETHIHPFKTYSTVKNKENSLYLHTSPEFQMKEILSMAKEEEISDIYQISYVFRDEPESTIHRPQFLMLEWYRQNVNYEKIMDDTINLLKYVQNCFKKKKYPLKKIDLNNVERLTVQNLFKRELNVDILDFLDTHKLKALIKDKFPDVPLPLNECSWDDYYFLLFLNKVEPCLENGKATILSEFPAPLAALSKLKESDQRVCERFEVYINGVELCNAFSELTNFKEQKKRFDQQSAEMKTLYGYELQSPERFYEALKKGLPVCSGNALGIERLIDALIKTPNPFYR